MISKLILYSLVLFTAACARPNNYLYPVPQPLPQRKVDPGPPGALHGSVTNAIDGRPLPGVTVTIHEGGPAGAILSTTSTDEGGNYDIQRLDPGAYSLDFALTGYVPIVGAPVTILPAQTTLLSESMTTILAANQYRIILNWDGPTEGAVRDVDSYMQVPGFESAPIGYSNPNPQHGANLDHDDTQWNGPETITITDLQPGTYTYYVNNFNLRCDPQALSRSGVTVRVYKGADLIRTYTIPPGIGITYHFFDIVDGRLVDVNQWADYLPTYGGGLLCDRFVAPRPGHAPTPGR